ncbi:tetratricopeptide repeat protein [Candidatus Azambacteria bacterium]|nr:tetratricopeptide repeat protein [Candidatus Azambacteria bacterium]
MEQIQIEKKRGWFSLDGLIFKLLCLGVFLAPIFFLPLGAHPVTFNRQFLMVFIIFLSFFIYLNRSWKEGKLVLTESYKTPLLFFVIYLASLFFSDSINQSIFGIDGGDVDSFINIISFVLSYFLVSSTLSVNEAKTLVKFYLGSISLLLIFHFFQVFGSFLSPELVRNSKFLSEGFTTLGFTTLGSILSLLVFYGANLVLTISILLNATLSKRANLFLWILSGAIFAFLLILNHASFGFIWLLLGLSFILILLLKMSVDGLKVKGINLLIVFITLSSFLYFFPIKGLYDYFKYGIQISEPALSARASLDLVKTTWFSGSQSVGAVKDFLIGQGGGNFSNQYLKWRPVDFNYIRNFDFSSIPSLSLLVVYSMSFGILGILSFLLFLLSNFFRSLISVIKEKKGLIITVALPFIFYLIISGLVFEIGYVMVLALFVSLALLKVEDGSKIEINIFSTSQRIFVLSFIMIFLMIVSLGSIYLEAMRFMASVYYDSGIRALQARDTNLAISKISNAISLDKKNDSYLRGLVSVLLTKLNSEPAKFQENFQTIIFLNNLAIRLNPFERLNYINQAKTYETLLVALLSIKDRKLTEDEASALTNTYKIILDSYQKALELDPKDPIIPLFVARVHFSNNKLEEAEKSLNEVLKLKSDYGVAYFTLGQVYEKQGKSKEAIIETQKSLSLSPQDLGVILQLGILYYRGDQLENGKDLMEQAVTIYPSNSSFRELLGLIYDKLGFKDKAVDQFEEELKLNPGNPEIKNLINNIKSGKSAVTPPSGQ